MCSCLQYWVVSQLDGAKHTSITLHEEEEMWSSVKEKKKAGVWQPNLYLSHYCTKSSSEIAVIPNLDTSRQVDFTHLQAHVPEMYFENINSYIFKTKNFWTL